MDAPRVPVQVPGSSSRLAAALRFGAGASMGGSLSSTLSFLCAQVAGMLEAPAVLAYALERGDELVLRGVHGYDPGAVGEVRLRVGQGIVGTAVETLRPLTVDDARLAAQFAYFPQLAEERFPAYLAVPLLSGPRPRGALVVQREQGPFPEHDLFIAFAASRAFTAAIEAEHPSGAQVLLSGKGNGRGRALGIAAVLTRALPRRPPPRREEPLAGAFRVVREEIRALAGRATAALAQPCPALAELLSAVEDVRLEERAAEHESSGRGGAVALERIAAEVARGLQAHGAAARRSVDVEAFLGAVAHRHAGLEEQRFRRGKLAVAVHLSGLAALRGWSAGLTGAVCAMPAEEATGAAILAALGLPVVSDVRTIFSSVAPGDRIALDAVSGEVVVNPGANTAAAWRK